MNTDNPIIRPFTLTLFTVLAFGAIACGAVPGESTGTDESALDTAAPSTPGSPGSPVDPEDRDGGAAPLRPGGHDLYGRGEPATWSTRAPGAPPIGGYRADRAAHSR
jgi:hypothetical protein